MEGSTSERFVSSHAYSAWQKPDIETVMRELEVLVPEIANERRAVEASIRRLLHADKISVYNRAILICNSDWEKDMRKKLDYHTLMAKAPDEQVLNS